MEESGTEAATGQTQAYLSGHSKSSSASSMTKQVKTVVGAATCVAKQSEALQLNRRRWLS
jgi:hypothetical protein